jgi:hypothetical protein
MWVEFKVPADGLEDVLAWSKGLVGELRTTSGNEWVHGLDHG